MNRSTKSLVLNGVAVSLLAVNTGCYSPQPRLDIDFDQMALKYERGDARVGVEPLDTGKESKRAFWYDVTEKNIIPFFVRVENMSLDSELYFNQENLKFLDNTGVEWGWLQPESAARSSAMNEMALKGGLIGASLGLLTLPLIPVIQASAGAEWEKRYIGFREQAFPRGEQTIYPEGAMYGSIFFVKTDKARGNLQERLTGGRLVVPYKIGNLEFKKEFILGKAVDYLNRQK